ncbi:P-loop containing nucleoside triphosphate hydrolase protein [Xylariales sp. PMI_506]|nr:P-loop containing nucleoside triphosphate hydrolase protein [Xylariales sp. PMI_506]
MDTARNTLWDPKDVLKWFKQLKPLRVDLVGDFIGKECFIIHGEAALAYCVQNAKVDFQGGFQLLHAVHAVETFLAKLKHRGCNFHIVWFDNLTQLCIPLKAPKTIWYKYQLLRVVLIWHLAHETSVKSSGGVCSYRFASLESGEFSAYLVQASPQCILCSGDNTSYRKSDVNALVYLHVGHYMAVRGYCVGFLDDLEFDSSKVYVRTVAPSIPPKSGGSKELPVFQNSDLHRLKVNTDWKQYMKQLKCLSQDKALTAREGVTLCAVAMVVSVDTSTDIARRKQQVADFLAHIAILGISTISQRSFSEAFSLLAPEDEEFLAQVSLAAQCVLEYWDGEGLKLAVWDAYDLLDGRMFAQIRNGRLKTKLADGFCVDFARLVAVFRSLQDFDVSTDYPTLRLYEPNAPPTDIVSHGMENSNLATSTVLPFSHPIIDKYLYKVQLETNYTLELPTASKICQELTHWHNAKRPIDPKFRHALPGFRARKLHQKRMADMIAYSASLTGANGKIISPEPIIICGLTESKGSKKTASNHNAIGGGSRAATGKQKQLPGGRKEALQAARSLKQDKIDKKSTDIVSYWSRYCTELETESSLVKRYIKAEKYLQSIPVDHSSVCAEVYLYLCHILVLAQASNQDISMNGIHTLTQEAARQLACLSEALGISPNLSQTLPLRRSLPFNSSFGHTPKMLFRLKQPLEFQLNHCGPYLERGFDAAPDPRVSFNPDAWQRKVLDAIDSDKSLFVVAPTSSGKTFISFYAMKKILQADNDGVLVYVAPTKALVNQIAAEVQGRFTKTYHGESQGNRTVWCIHTRDYRINDPQRCQILVTVPHILQIMLLSPSNARDPNSFSRRVRRIIFDEVHCIGQSEDGVIWEQLLLLAPCPIIALSATVGNPSEFTSWLSEIQDSKGFELETIVHESRYSDLRKFIYRPPKSFCFDGLAPVERLPYPGLDCTEIGKKRFICMHPIGAMIGRSKETLRDVALEPRDCLMLWHSMAKHQNKSFPLGGTLEPSRFLNKLTRKSDTILWGEALKGQLEKWLTDVRSPFDAVREELRGSEYTEWKASFENGAESLGFDNKANKSSAKSDFSLLLDLRSNGALPAIVFNYDRDGCEKILGGWLVILRTTERCYKESPAWTKKVERFEEWKKLRTKYKKRVKDSSSNRPEDGVSKLDRARDKASEEASEWESFKPEMPLAEYSFADTTKTSAEEVEQHIGYLKCLKVRPTFLDALKRGLGVHHAGMNRQYRQIVEMLFRRGYLTVVVATGTLALGINMPCKTVVFAGDSVFLSALNYRQASGRAGRRGFDILGNVVFHGIPPHRALEIMSTRLPDLRGQFPYSATLVLRLFTLLHATGNTEYATKAIESLLTQSRLYLGGPEEEMAIQHHLRFSIEYLRRQLLLSENGVPLNFSGLVGHLYFTENAVFAFHSLLMGGYFHELCSDFNTSPARRPEILLKLVITLCHLFCRIPYHSGEKVGSKGGARQPSPSVVILPDLPEPASTILATHNRDTLLLFQGYVQTYVSQHLSGVKDNKLPFTKHKVDQADTEQMDPLLDHQPEPVVRSQFAALSGFTDEFESIRELCSSVRSGVFLDETSIPYIRISGKETEGEKWNAYIYDFFKHGDMHALVRDNGIKRGDVWFRLKDFSMILATIVTSLHNFMTADGGSDDAAMLDIQDIGDIMAETASVDGDIPVENISTMVAVDDEALEGPSSAPRHRNRKPKKDTLIDSWEDAVSDTQSADESEQGSSLRTDGGSYTGFDSDGNVKITPSWCNQGRGSLATVYQAFQALGEEFDEKFKKEWA